MYLPTHHNNSAAAMSSLMAPDHEICMVMYCFTVPYLSASATGTCTESFSWTLLAASLWTFWPSTTAGRLRCYHLESTPALKLMATSSMCTPGVACVTFSLSPTTSSSHKRASSHFLGSICDMICGSNSAIGRMAYSSDPCSPLLAVGSTTDFGLTIWRHR